MAAANLHLILFNEGANVLSLSKGEQEAFESLAYSKFMWSQLPDFLKLPIGRDQQGYLSFADMHSRIRALASTRDAGVGFGGATRVVMDEFEYHDYARENYTEIYPAIEHSGQLVILSTADRFRVGTKFKELYRGAQSGNNRFQKIFFPYTVIPGRDKGWYDSLDLDEADKECRYPLTEQDALKTSKTSKFLNEDVLESMYRDCKTPLDHELTRKYGDMVKIFSLPVVGKRYFIFTDPSDGKEDPHALIVIDAYGDQQAESHGKVTADVAALIHDDLVRLYYNAANTYELNNVGRLFGDKLDDMGTPNQASFLKADGTLDYEKRGWWTGSKKLKSDLLWKFEEAIRLRQFTPRSKEMIDEFMNFLKIEGQDMPQAAQGAHDDYIDAACRVWRLRDIAAPGEIKVSSWQYKES